MKINCDLGEGLPNDADLMSSISQCNIAAGGHAGNEISVKKTIALALRAGVEIGAHPSYPDRKNFGRISIEISAERLAEELTKQINLVERSARELGGKMTHIKLHGALYNDAAKSIKLARFICSHISKNWPEIPLFVPPKSAFFELKTSVNFITEAFLDRTYTNELSLLGRNFPEALIIEPDKVYQQAKNLVKRKGIVSNEGNFISLHAETFCLHGDNPRALEIINYLKNHPL